MGQVAGEKRYKISAVLSCPSLGWNDHWGQVMSVLGPYGIEVRKGKGAYWHQTMQMLLESCIRDGIDLILTLDYDSLFNKWHFKRLLYALQTTPEADAMAAFQVRRGSVEQPLCAPIEPGIERFVLDGSAIEMKSAHFGMTLIKTSALQKMPKPWFVGHPNEDGSFGDGRIDPDIDFWHKFRAAGNRVFVDPFCNIGHLQVMVSEFVCKDNDVVPVHTHIHDWMERAVPDLDEVNIRQVEAAGVA